MKEKDTALNNNNRNTTANHGVIIMLGTLLSTFIDVIIYSSKQSYEVGKARVIIGPIPWTVKLKVREVVF